MWLYILNEYSSKECASNLIVYFYFTSLEKRLPNSNIDLFWIKVMLIPHLQLRVQKIRKL